MENRIPLIGDTFPDMEVKTTHGMMNLPKDFAGKWFILFSHPADFTPVCTTEFVAFQNRYPEFRKLNCELIGLSIDQVYSHIKWHDWILENLKVDIEFPIIADNGDISKSLGFIHPGKGTNTVRAVFIIDDTAKIRAIVYYPQELGRNFDELLRMVRAIQIADKEHVAMPANWPNNELIGDKVIVPPASDIKSAKYKQSRYDNYDWWFCYRDLKNKE
ncbi:MAG: peroxiredoxin [Ignavibacteriae bacterium HGW-Ignavibacteriae-1]|jgi:peroxiredoxin (alkyl hydroperoxide reductase subunit C)|nr:MAG: peroxiredoxin [Ignavibacteriae bacterium HGW-Ignavibacteriae-1]